MALYTEKASCSSALPSCCQKVDLRTFRTFSTPLDPIVLFHLLFKFYSYIHCRYVSVNLSAKLITLWNFFYHFLSINTFRNSFTCWLVFLPLGFLSGRHRTHFYHLLGITLSATIISLATAPLCTLLCYCGLLFCTLPFLFLRLFTTFFFVMITFLYQYLLLVWCSFSEFCGALLFQ